MTKVLKNMDKKWGRGGRMGDNNILLIYATGPTKNATLKSCVLGNFFLFVFVKFLNSCSNSLKAFSPGQKQNLLRSFSGQNQFYLISINVL